MIILGIVFLLAGALVYAYGGTSPSVIGHSSGEIELPSNVCLTNGTGCPSRLSSCSFSCTIGSCTSSGYGCPSGYTPTGLYRTSCDGWSGNNYFCCRLTCS